MYISMQGSWTINVKSIETDYPRRFVISGAATGNAAPESSCQSGNVRVAS